MTHAQEDPCLDDLSVCGARAMSHCDPDPCNPDCPDYDECFVAATPVARTATSAQDGSMPGCPDYDECNPVHDWCPDYDECYCNPDPCNPDCPDYDECYCADPCERRVMDPIHATPTARTASATRSVLLRTTTSATGSDPCNPGCPDYDECYCDPDPCNPGCPDYDECYCDPDPCNPDRPDYDPCECGDGARLRLGRPMRLWMERSV